MYLQTSYLQTSKTSASGSATPTLRNIHTSSSNLPDKQASGSHGTRGGPRAVARHASTRNGRNPHSNRASLIREATAASPSMSRADQRREPAATHAKRPLVGRIGSGEGLVSYAGVQIKSCIR